MGGKFQAKKPGKASREKKLNKNKLLPVVSAAAVLLILVIVMAGRQDVSQPNGETTMVTGMFETVQPTTVDYASITYEGVTEAQEQIMPLGSGVDVVKIGKYTGIYMEDGSDETVTDVLMVVLTNSGAESVQYGAFHLTNGTETANFQFTTLLPGQSMVVLESGRMPWRSDLKFSELTVDNVALFDAAPGLCEDQVQITVLDGMVRIENVSGKDITGNVVAYYKNVAQDLLYGGITYRVRAEGGLKAGESVDILASHCSAKGSRIVFVTCD